MTYRGYYTYNGEKFHSEFKVKKSDDKSFYAEGEDKTGKFSIDAKVASSGFLEATKQYFGAHALRMLGRVEKVKGAINKLNGVWELPNVSTGDFEYFLYEG
jgi:hypothetical protein